MRFYFTFRYLYLGQYIYTPAYVFENNFPGLDFQYTYLCGNYVVDGRHLAVVTYTGDLPESEVLQLLGEALAPYAFHLKTPEKSLEFAQYITARTDLYLDNGELIFPPLPMDPLQ